MEKRKYRKSSVVLTVIISTLLIAMLVVFIMQRLDSKIRSIAEIYQNGVLVDVVNIAESEGYRLTLEDGNGGYNIIGIIDGKIGVEETNCPDKTCLNMGFLREGGVPIICLPHKAEIRFVKNTSGIDAVSY